MELSLRFLFHRLTSQIMKGISNSIPITMPVGAAMRVVCEKRGVDTGCGEGVGDGLWETTVVKDAAADNWVLSELCERLEDVDTGCVVEVRVGLCDLVEEVEDRTDEDALPEF